MDDVGELVVDEERACLEGPDPKGESLVLAGRFMASPQPKRRLQVKERRVQVSAALVVKLGCNIFAQYTIASDDPMISIVPAEAHQVGCTLECKPLDKSKAREEQRCAEKRAKNQHTLTKRPKTSSTFSRGG
eukprot:3949145-Amphidinium_carterae.1